jgi:hypothetical protein
MMHGTVKVKMKLFFNNINVSVFHTPNAPLVTGMFGNETYFFVYEDV